MPKRLLELAHEIVDCFTQMKKAKTGSIDYLDLISILEKHFDEFDTEFAEDKSELAIMLDNFMISMVNFEIFKEDLGRMRFTAGIRKEGKKLRNERDQHFIALQEFLLKIEAFSKKEIEPIIPKPEPEPKMSPTLAQLPTVDKISRSKTMLYQDQLYKKSYFGPQVIFFQAETELGGTVYVNKNGQFIYDGRKNIAILDFSQHNHIDKFKVVTKTREDEKEIYIHLLIEQKSTPLQISRYIPWQPKPTEHIKFMKNWYTPFTSYETFDYYNEASYLDYFKDHLAYLLMEDSSTFSYLIQQRKAITAGREVNLTGNDVAGHILYSALAKEMPINIHFACRASYHEFEHRYNLSKLPKAYQEVESVLRDYLPATATYRNGNYLFMLISIGDDQNKMLVRSKFTPGDKFEINFLHQTTIVGSLDQNLQLKPYKDPKVKIVREEKSFFAALKQLICEKFEALAKMLTRNKTAKTSLSMK